MQILWLLTVNTLVVLLTEPLPKGNHSSIILVLMKLLNDAIKRIKTKLICLFVFYSLVHHVLLVFLDFMMNYCLIPDLFSINIHSHAIK